MPSSLESKSYEKLTNFSTEEEFKRKAILLKRKRSYQRNRVIIGILLLVVLILTFFAIKSINDKQVDTYNLGFITEDRLYNSLESSAVLIRDETLLSTDTAGRIIPLAVEGTELAYGSKLAMVVQEDIEHLNDQLDNIETQIAQRQDQLFANGQEKESSQIFSSYDDQLKQQIKLLISSQTQGNYLGLSQMEAYLKSLLEARSIQLSKLALNDVVLTELYKQRDSLIRQIESKAKTYYLPDPGVVSYSYDGREEKWNLKNYENFSLEDLSKLFAERENYRSVLSDDKRELVGRLVTDLSQILIVRLSNEAALSLQESNYIDLYIPQENMNLDGSTVIKKLSDSQYTYFFVKTNDGMVAMLNQRYLPVQVKTKSAFGFKVPNSSLEIMEDQPEQGILTLVVNGYARKVKVHIVIQNTGFAIIENLESNNVQFDIGSVIILRAGSVAEGTRVE